jgi:hypothetical protein
MRDDVQNYDSYINMPQSENYTPYLWSWTDIRVWDRLSNTLPNINSYYVGLDITSCRSISSRAQYWHTSTAPRKWNELLFKWYEYICWESRCTNHYAEWNYSLQTNLWLLLWKKVYTYSQCGNSSWSWSRKWIPFMPVVYNSLNIHQSEDINWSRMWNIIRAANFGSKHGRLVQRWQFDIA